MKSWSNTDRGNGATISLDIPAQDANIFKSQAVHDILSFFGGFESVSENQDYYARERSEQITNICGQNHPSVRTLAPLNADAVCRLYR